MMPVAWRSILTRGGTVVPWRHTDRLVCTLTADHVAELRSESALRRILAHEFLLDGQLENMYGTRAKLIRGQALRRCARRIRASGRVHLCRGMGERQLCAFFSKPRASDRDVMIGLMTEPVNDDAAALDDVGDFIEAWEKSPPAYSTEERFAQLMKESAELDARHAEHERARDHVEIREIVRERGPKNKRARKLLEQLMSLEGSQLLELMQAFEAVRAR